MTAGNGIAPKGRLVVVQPPPKPCPASHLRKWQPGESGNPKGRPKGARQKLSEKFLSAMQDDFEVHGHEVIAKARAADPVAYLKVIASLLPKDFEIKPGQELKDLFDLVAQGGFRLVEGEDGQKQLECFTIDGEAEEIPQGEAGPLEGPVAASDDELLS